MGRGNVRVNGPYEGLYYIDNDDLRVYRKIDNDCLRVYRNGDLSFHIREVRLQRDLDYADITGPDWYLDEILSSHEEASVLECFCDEMQRLCPSFKPAANDNVRLGNGRRVILENDLFYICIEDNEWSMAVELIQKDGYSDCQNAWLSGLQRTKYKRYLECMKTALLTLLPSIEIYTGAWTSGRITREEAGL